MEDLSCVYTSVVCLHCLYADDILLLAPSAVELHNLLVVRSNWT